MMRCKNIEQGPRTDRKLNKYIIEKDNNTCQYCMLSNIVRPVSEHVIAYQMGGHTKPYNLVCACRSCNAIKGQRIWIPYNINELILINPKWGWKVIDLFRYQKTYNINPKYVQHDIDYGRNADIPILNFK